MKTIKTTEEKLQKIYDRYKNTDYNNNNYFVGGGLDSNKFASNRHEDAKYDSGKLTLGESIQLFKKATELDIETVRKVIKCAVPNPEWHHAGRLPKAYGGGMKKTYFLNAEQICYCAENWDLLMSKI